MRQRGAGHRLELLTQAGIVMLAAILLFWGLGQRYLWQDEAATAVLATRMLRFGRPMAYDGVNLITADVPDRDDDAHAQFHDGDPRGAIAFYSARGDFKPDTTWKWQPWGLFAIAAASIKVLGQTTLAARLPFALAGLATVPLLFHLVRKEFGSFPTAALSAVLLVSNVYWILHARQCRYYSVSSFFLVLTLLTYARWQWGGRGAAGFIAAAWCWFQVDYGTVLPVLAVLFLEAVAADWRSIRRTVVAGIVLTATLAPFVYFYDLLHRTSHQEENWELRFEHNLFNMNEYVVPAMVLLAALFVLATNWKSLAVAERRLVAVGCAILLALGVWVPTVAVYSFLRYAIIAAPVGALLTAWVIMRICGRRQWLALPAAAILIATPWLSVPLRAVVPPPDWWTGSASYRVELKELGAQIFGHQPDPNGLVIEWLRKNAAPSDEILINYEDIPLMYYLPNPIRGGIAVFRVEDDARTAPRFVILRRSFGFAHRRLFEREVRRYIWEPVPLKAPDVRWGNNPDPIANDDAAAAADLYIGRRVDIGGLRVGKSD